MNIVIGSAWRDSARNVRGYFRCVRKLQNFLQGHSVRVVAVEGDSKDNTVTALTVEAQGCGVPLDIVKFDQGTPRYGSTEQPERMRALSEVGNKIFDAVKDTDDVLVYVESDLLWEPEPIATLTDYAWYQQETFNVFSPLVFAGECFYDVWAFRGVDGERFSPFFPYHRSIHERGAKEGLYEVSSLGSCLVMRREVAQQVRMVNGGALVDWSAEARRKGFHLAVHTGLRVTHP